MNQSSSVKKLFFGGFHTNRDIWEHCDTAPHALQITSADERHVTHVEKTRQAIT